MAEPRQLWHWEDPAGLLNIKRDRAGCIKQNEQKKGKERKGGFARGDEKVKEQ